MCGVRALGAGRESASYNYFLEFEPGNPLERSRCVRTGECFSFPRQVSGVVDFSLSHDLCAVLLFSPRALEDMGEAAFSFLGNFFAL